MFVNIKFKVYN